MNGPQDEKGEQHEQQVEGREAWQYWGYLFKPDKTGTDKLKGLLSGLKNVMNEHSESSDCPDLTPNQLATFYQELHGNYNQLFLETPSESIAFIYKSLGCLYSLQPQEPKDGAPQSTAFADPTVPALKTEGWIMWQTIQLLLGPEEHSGFLMEAVQKWDVKDPTTGEMFPKALPRTCFPAEPDKHMVAWYEGVSERLRREAEEEERQREIEAHQAEVRRIQYRSRDGDEEGSVDSRGFARAYFNNPLYRHVDGRPSIVRRNSKRPALSPRPTGVMGKGKEAATTMGHVVRNIASPHLWDGGRAPSKSHSRERDRDRRRRSLPENRYRAEEAPTSAGYDANFSPGQDRHNHHRHPSGEQDRPSTASTDDTWTSEDNAPDHSHRHHHHRDDPELRHSRSHEPTPSQKEYGDYFQGYDDPSRQTSAYDNGGGTPLSSNGIGPNFGPSASPLFASHIARQPQPQPRMPPSTSQYGSPRPQPSIRRAQERPYSSSPDPSLRSRDRDDRRFSQSRERRRRDHSPGRSYADSHPPSARPSMQPGFPPVGAGPADRPPPGGYPSRSRDRRSGSGRRSGSDLSAYSAAEDQRPPRPKQTRFAAGVDGRVYPNEGQWR